MPQIALYVNNGMVADGCHYETFTHSPLGRFNSNGMSD